MKVGPKKKKKQNQNIYLLISLKDGFIMVIQNQLVCFLSLTLFLLISWSIRKCVWLTMKITKLESFVFSYLLAGQCVWLNHENHKVRKF